MERDASLTVAEQSQVLWTKVLLPATKWKIKFSTTARINEDTTFNYEDDEKVLHKN